MKKISEEYTEWAGLLWEEYKYRHELYWKSIYLWGGAATAVFMAPFLKPELKILGYAVFIFPVVGLALSLIGTWHLAAESERLSMVGKKYNQIRGKKYLPNRLYEGVKRSWYHQAILESIGTAITFLFILGFVAFFIIDVLFLFILLNPNKSLELLVTGFFVVLITLVTLILLVDRRRREHNKSNK